MCGILAILGSTLPEDVLRQRAIECSKRIRHRGPDWTGVCLQKIQNASGKQLINILCHERLSIVDLNSGEQPLLNEDETLALAVNGEIYNHVALRSSLLKNHKFKTGSDCEPILYMFEEEGAACVSKLDGMFSFVLSDSKTGEYLVARDHVGITSLYYGYGKDGSMWFSSELKSIKDDCPTFYEFPPGHYYESKTKQFTPWYSPKWYSEEYVPSTELDYKLLRDTLEKAVVKRLMTDVPYGVLLSGGLDSSLVAALASRHVNKRVEDGETSQAWWPRLHSFTIGLKDSPDIKAAQEVADFLGTVHHSWTFTVQQGIDALVDVIYHLETYDVTTIRASTPMYLMSRRIKATGVKMVLSGEGADEVFGGYLYFHKAPNKEELHKETVRKIKSLHYYDCLRAHKSTMAWGVEGRVPFLDRAFLEVAMNLDPAEKLIKKEENRYEKYILRKAFDDKENPLLPHHLLWRQKEQFSDGVGYSWIDSLKKYADESVSDDQFAVASHRFPVNTPMTKEAFLYRSIFEKLYPQTNAVPLVPWGPSVACSSPIAAEWDKAWKGKADPSGRAVIDVHQDGKTAC
jgi:asparagine synthase (glutamine-hydrolysing)